MPVDGLLLFATIHIEPNDVILHLGQTTLVNIQSAMHAMYPLAGEHKSPCVPRSDLHGQHLGMKRQVEKIKCKEMSILQCQRKQDKNAHFDHKLSLQLLN